MRAGHFVGLTELSKMLVE